ncbi:MAG: thiamine-phosphate kinase [Acidimicrobiales bacterium]
MPIPNSTASGRTDAGQAPANEGGEIAAIERIRAALPGAPPGQVWIGDDSAVLPGIRSQMLLATDLTVAGVHADLDLVGLDDMGWKAVAVTVSDVAAMGGRPREVLVAVAGPPDTDLDLLYDGIGLGAARHGCAVVGGDLSDAGQLVVCVAVTGFVPKAVLRSGATPGDFLFVTGPLGASAAGLRLLRQAAPQGHGRAGAIGGTGTGTDAGAIAVHGVPGGTGSTSRAGSTDDVITRHLIEAHRRPVARLAEGEAARLAGCRAMIDVSDGLALDIHRLADASGVGFRLDQVPVASGALADEALAGGEDYELIMAVADPARLVARFTGSGLAEPVLIGVCVEDPTERTLAGEPLVPRGWEHTWS